MSKDVAIEAAEAAAAAKAPYWDPPPAPLLDTSELKKWSLYRALIAEFVATLIFLYVSIATVIGYKAQSGQLATCTGVGFLGVAWSFGATIFILVYCTGGVSGGHINPAVTFGLFVGRKLSLVRTVLYIVAQCLGAICGVGIVKGITGDLYKTGGGGVNSVGDGFSVGSSLAAEILGTFVLVYTVFSATDPKRTARDSFIPVLVPLPIGFAVFVVHLATIPITGTGINPARSLGAAVMDMKFTNHGPAFCFAPSPQNLRTGPGHQTNIRSMYMMHIFVYAQWIFWVGPAIGAIGAALYHKLVLRGEAVKALGSFRSTSATV